MGLLYNKMAVGNGLYTDHPIPDLPFVDDSHLPLDDPAAVEAIGRKEGGQSWGRTDRCKDGGWVAFTTDALRSDLGWVVRWHPEHGRSVVLYRDEDVADAYMSYVGEALLYRAGGYWWDGTTWYRPALSYDRARETYVNRPVPAALTISAADQPPGDPGNGTLWKITDLDIDMVKPTASRRWRDDLALWAVRHDTGRHLAGCVIHLTAPELAADQLVDVAELAEIAGIGASTLRAYRARGESGVPLPQATVGGRAMWSRPVAEDWAEDRRRSYDGAARAMADRDHDNLSVGVARIWDYLTNAFTIDLWDRGHRKRFTLRWRTQAAVREVAHDLAWTATASLDRIIPLGDLGTTIHAAVLFEFADWQRTTPNEQVSYPINHAITRMLDWLIQHKPDQAQAVVAQIVGEAERTLGISPEITGFSLRQALVLDGKLPGENAYAEFLNLALPPDN
ncbi:hypothetical protein EV385_6600 [Krasilnikovia cinnamomea]|uniref:Helix-turn-helix protein n=1 Tax=Krasilnikovia cinnamomea TaxID=349313 RepID=A0A4V2G5X8_9ACTN|nr:helix-turn-helix domain-containing protein [Krasilnikovia cinnamomea]RZU46526.1 hypothetical protein EV385_6600 [Krasilnikovia cinnamomea]